MAENKNRSKKARSRTKSGRNGHETSGRKRSKREFPDYSIVDPHDLPDGPDVLLDVPVVKVDEIDIEVDDLRAQVAVQAEVRDLVDISVGADVELGKVELKIEGVEAQALLKARLDNVALILERVLTSLDRNPELLEGIGHAVENVGEGTGQLVGGAGEAVEDVGEGAGKALPEVGEGAGQALGQVGQGAGQAAGQVGEGAGRAVSGVGEGAQQATQKLAGGGGQNRSGGGDG
jgi:hypothetical protein